MFYPLAEELRKIGRFEEAERTLRDGLRIHPTYLSAWISLGRVLRDTERNQEAIEVLEKASALDPGNVVAARLMADGYLALGAKLDALKKYKLVYALLPADPEVESIIERLDREVNPDRYPAAPAPAAPTVPPPAPEPAPPVPPVVTAPVEAASSFVPEPPLPTEEQPFDFGGLQAPAPEMESEGAAAPEESPFEAAGEAPPEFDVPPAPDASAAFMPQEMAPPADESPFADEEPVAGESPLAEPSSYAPAVDVEPPFEAASEATPEPEPAFDAMPEPAEPWAPPAELAPSEADESLHGDRDVTATITMADLYVRQGYVGAAREIYERILEHDPANDGVRAKLAALPAESKTREVRRREAVQRLEEWLTRVGRREGSRV